MTLVPMKKGRRRHARFCAHITGIFYCYEYNYIFTRSLHQFVEICGGKWSLWDSLIVQIAERFIISRKYNKNVG